ncbi:Carbohydrate sulfotransferase 1 [Halotydeus destructor]|nr:Carbohydrate sulfotransferase 1 [Halotydeus destructor]
MLVFGVVLLFAVASSKRIILVSYRSSGSSFAGNLIQQTAGSFYFYEPFRRIIGMDYRFNNGQYMNALNELEELFTCSDRVFDRSYWMDGDIRNLLLDNSHLIDSCNYDESGNQCNGFALQMQSACKMADHHVIKTVRLPMEAIVSYYRSDIAFHNETLQIVYLYRDARGVMNSRKSRSWCSSKPACSSTVDLCTDMRLDWELFKYMKYLYPNNFHLLTFEELAMEPEMEAKRLFQLLNLTYTADVEHFIREHTRGHHGNSTTTSSVETSIRDSKDVAYKWKKELSVDEANFIEYQCADVVDEIEYQIHVRPPLRFENGTLQEPPEQLAIYKQARDLLGN